MLRLSFWRFCVGLKQAKLGILLSIGLLLAPACNAPGTGTLSLSELRETYEVTNSEYLTLDEIEVHVVDEYDGPPVLLLHASGLNLRAWDSLAKTLGKSRRVIRLDWPASGLTGPDPLQAESIERYLAIVDQLLTELKVEQVDVIGTSTGGITAFQLASAFPDRVSRLVLINAAGLPRTQATNPNQSRAALAAYDGMEIKPLDYYEKYFGMIFRPPYEVPGWLLRMTYDIDRRQDITQEQNRFLSNFKTGDPQNVLAQIAAPSLILWGAGKQALLAPDQADQFQSWMINAPSLVIKYPNLGHYPYLEEPGLINRDIFDFLNGDLDARLSPPQ